jgi:hypothetical protein
MRPYLPTGSARHPDIQVIERLTMEAGGFLKPASLHFAIRQ